MSLENCRAAFAHQPQKEIARKVHAATAEPCGCEAFSMANESPGPVQDEETLQLIISDPVDLQDDGSLNPTCLVRLDTSGVSVLRGDATNDEFELTITELMERSAAASKSRRFLGVCLFSAQTVRYRDGARLTGVYDTALPGKPHHADILAPAIPTDISKSQAERAKRKRIKEIITLIGRCFDPARSFRDGAFVRHS